MDSVAKSWGGIDIYFFDQLLRGRLTASMPFLDVGCGAGRNLLPLLAHGFDGHGSDQDSAALVQLEQSASEIGVEIKGRLRQEPADRSSHRDARFGFVLANAVLHFAEDEAHFERMLDEMWRVLMPGGVFFARLASTITMEAQVSSLRGRWYRLPDGTDRFLVDREFLARQARRIGGAEIDPVKTVHVEGKRAMTNWCLRKPGSMR